MKLILLILVCFISQEIFAQEEEKKKIHFGIKAGAQLASVAPDFKDDDGNMTDYQSRFGIVLGARIQLPVNKNFLFMPELTLIGKGANSYRTLSNGPRYDDYQILSSFLELTTNLVFVSSSKSGKFLLGGGPSIAKNLSNYSTILGNKDFGINVLAGYQLPLGFSFEINFNKGLIKQKPFDTYFNPNPVSAHLKTSSFGFNVGYLF